MDPTRAAALVIVAGWVACVLVAIAKALGYVDSVSWVALGVLIIVPALFVLAVIALDRMFAGMKG